MNRPTACLPVAAIVLAAGSGSRMGQLKQLLSFDGQTLVENAVRVALDAGFDPIIVVVGAQSASVRKMIASKHVVIVENEQWQSGMGSSISAGVRQLRELGTDSAAVAILLVDQPLVTASHLREMKKLLSQPGTKIVAAQYTGVLGVPVIFKRDLFSVLAALEPQVGARLLLRDRNQAIMPFDLPEAAVDVDTPEDFAALTTE